MSLKSLHKHVSETSSTKEQSPSILDSHHNYPDISKHLVVDLTLPLKTVNPSQQTSHDTNVHPMITRTKLKNNPNLALQALRTTHIEPKTLKIVFKNPLWLQAMKEELQALHQNNTWTLVPKPENTNIIGTKWVYNLKYKEDGFINIYKARPMGL